MVELLRRYANRADLLDDLTRTMARLQGVQTVPVEEQAEALYSACQHARQDLVSLRFSSDDISRMIERYRAGVTTREVANEFKIGTTTLKRLIRERGARRKDR
jgi:Helix-turn-helix domain of resolvase